MKRTLYSNEFLTFTELMEIYNWRVVEEGITFENDEEREEWMRNEHDFNNEHDWHDLASDLNIRGDYIVIADLGLWHGRVTGYKLTNKLIDALFDNGLDTIKVYTDAYNLRYEGYHHDGYNEAIVREFKDSISEEQKDNFLDKMHRGAITKQDVSRYTRSVKMDALEALGYL